MKRLLFTVPKNVVKRLLFTVLSKPFRSLSIMGARRYKNQELERGVEDKNSSKEKDRAERRR